MAIAFNPLEYSLCFEKPWRLTDISSWHEHMPFAFCFVEMLKPEIFVELGTHKGDSYCAFCQAVHMLKLDCACYAIDTWKGDEHTGFYSQDVLEELRSYHAPLYGAFSQLIKTTFDQALSDFSDLTVDLLHIDGLHSYEAVKHDFEAWLPKMSNRGVILFHDTNVREGAFGVWRLWEELTAQYPHFEFKHGYGLGVLGVGKEIPKKVKSFLSMSNRDRVLIADFFSYLGSRMTLESRINQTVKDLSQAEETLTNQAKETEEITNRLEREKLEISQGYEAEIKRIEEDKNEIHRGYGAEIKRMEEGKNEIQRGYGAEITRLDNEIKNFQQEISDFRGENARLSQDILALEKEKEHLENVSAQFMARMHEIQSSFAWYLILRFRRLIGKLLPENTRRRRLYHLFVRALSILLVEGPKSLGRKIVSRMQVKRKRKESLDFTTSPLREWHPLSFPLFDEIEVTIIIPVHNQSRYTFNCLESILKNTNAPYEVIVIDNGSNDDTSQLLEAMENVRVIHNQENQGFVTACIQGAAAALGENLLFLNNDTEVTKGWLEALLEPLMDEKVGVVGAKLVYPNGRLQETGNIIWQDGSGWNYGRGDDPDLPPYSYLKEVDYCSGACLLIRKELYLKLGGFDTRYEPAYYEDTDLCFAARQQGYKVIYQPEARVIHHEGVTAGTDIASGYKKYQQVNLGKFREKWHEVLKRDHFKGVENLYLARERGFKKRILVVDHHVPTFDMDSGSLRMFSLLKIFTELGYKVIFWPANKAYHERYTRELQKIGVEALYGEISFDKYLKSYGQYIDLVLLSRPSVAIDHISPAKKLTKASIIYDTVDLHFVREGRRARIEANHASESERYKEMELFLAHQADDVFVISPLEKEILEKEGFKDKVFVVPNVHSLEECDGSFDQREGLMFIGGFIHLPNEDGIVWFAERILPLIHQKLAEVKLYIVGSHPTKKVKSLASSDIIVTGYVPDVGPYFEKARIFVSPLRYGAGLKVKIGQSMAYGLPVVTTTVGAEGFDLVEGHSALIADEEEEFADKVIQLYQDRSLWKTLSLNSRKLIEQNYTPDVIKKKIKSFLEGKNKL